MDDKGTESLLLRNFFCFIPLTDLEIKVGNFLRVKVVHPIQDLLNEAGGLLLTQRLLLGQEIEQFSSGHSGRHQWGGPGPVSFVRQEAWLMGAGPTPNLDSLENRIPLALHGTNLGLIITEYWLCFCILSVEPRSQESL